MAGPGGSAKLVYSDRCQVSVIPGRVVSVGKQIALIGTAKEQTHRVVVA
jgi:hypothetical protein